MQIDLSDHVGLSPNGEPVDFNQWIVFCDGVHVGYLQKVEDAWLQCIVYMDESTKSELIDAVSTAAMQKIGGAAVPVDPDYLKDNEQGEEDE